MTEGVTYVALKAPWPPNFGGVNRLRLILDWLPAYTRKDLAGDLPAGLTVGVMLVPQGMAYAPIAGLSVVYGLYASLFPQRIYATMGTSRTLALGPVAMDSLLVAGNLAGMAMVGSDLAAAELALLLALMMGLIQWLLGTLRMGFLADFLSRPVISGSTSAAAPHHRAEPIVQPAAFPALRSAQLHVLIQGRLNMWMPCTSPPWASASPPSAQLVLLRRRPRKFRCVGRRRARHPGGGARHGGHANRGRRAFRTARIPCAWTRWVMCKPCLPWPPRWPSSIAFMEAFSVAKSVAQQRKDPEVDANQELRALGTANVLGSFGAHPTHRRLLLHRGQQPGGVANRHERPDFSGGRGLGLNLPHAGLSVPAQGSPGHHRGGRQRPGRCGLLPQPLEHPPG